MLVADMILVLIGATTADTAVGLDVDSLGTITTTNSSTTNDLNTDIALTAAGGAKISTNFTKGATGNTTDDLFGAVVVLNSSTSHTAS